MDRLTVAVHTTAPDTDGGEEEKEQQADEVGKPHTQDFGLNMNIQKMFWSRLYY